jgi:hypothetical protein
MAMNTHQAVTNDDDDLIPASIVKQENGGVSDMTIWRWQRDPQIQFPMPDVIINGRRYWKRSTMRGHRRHIENLSKEQPKFQTAGAA